EMLSPPEGLYEEFAARFPYPETEDQLRAIEDTLGDMVAGKPMDRLICGDVGFGKTEVALRAAFITAFAGGQVAVIVPTTLLARQHYRTFCERFAGLPVHIAQLSRLVLPKDAKQIKADIADGKIEIVVGTHALLAKDVREEVRKMAPEIRVAVAHGRMPAVELETVMTAFDERAYDLLLSTNIIESGLDIPTANTLIVHRADMFGLAQLYQLRGRIGRSKLRAYCYLTLPEKKQLAPTALRRLEVMQTLDTLGAGFQLASHDLDIRGAGNLLGDEQSGHIREVGLE